MSNDNNNDLGAIGFVAGGILLVAVGSMLIKAFTEFLRHVELFFLSLANSATAFAIFCFAACKLILIIGVTCGILYFCGYLIIRYRKLVKEATEVRYEIAVYRTELRQIVESRVSGMEESLTDEMRSMRSYVREALKPPTATPPPVETVNQVASNLSNGEPTSAPQPDPAKALESTDLSSIRTAQTIESHISSVTNPY